MLYGNISMGISSWSGQGSPTDQHMPLLLQAAKNTNFQWVVFDQQALKPATADAIHSDLAYIQSHYAGDPIYQKIDGRFVVFVIQFIQWRM